MSEVAKNTRRLDKYMVQQLPGVSRNAIEHLIKNGAVQVNGAPVTKAGYTLKPTDEVDYTYNPEQAILEAIDLPILYEDSDCVVINKPVGVLAHSKGAFNPEATVATWLEPKTHNLEGDRAGIVHRLDRATSGVMICAKHPEALRWLQKQFSERKVKKTYNALIIGTLTPEAAVIDMPIERNPKKPQTFRVGSNGKSAITRYAVVDKSSKYSLLELRPETGRTHQLRVHLKHFNKPIVGDTFYEGEPAERLFLHAAALEITLPNKQRKIFSAHLPSEFQEKLHGG